MEIFNASNIECYEEDGVLIVSVGDGAVDPKNYMIISRLDDEDNSTIDDGIGFQTAGSDYEMAGSISRVVLESNSLKVEIKPQFVSHFGAQTFLAKFNDEALKGGKLAALHEALVVLLEGSAVKLVA